MRTLYFYYCFSRFYNIPSTAKIVKTVKRNILAEAAFTVDIVEDDGLKHTIHRTGEKNNRLGRNLSKPAS